MASSKLLLLIPCVTVNIQISWYEPIKGPDLTGIWFPYLNTICDVFVHIDLTEQQIINVDISLQTSNEEKSDSTFWASLLNMFCFCFFTCDGRPRREKHFETGDGWNLAGRVFDSEQIPSGHQSLTTLMNRCLLTVENTSQHMQTCQHTQRHTHIHRCLVNNFPFLAVWFPLFILTRQLLFHREPPL